MQLNWPVATNYNIYIPLALMTISNAGICLLHDEQKPVVPNILKKEMTKDEKYLVQTVNNTMTTILHDRT